MKRALSPKDLAAAIGVSESSLKRWADAGKITVARTEGGHRRIPIAEAVRFIRATGAEIVRPEVLGLAEIAAVANDDGSDDALFTHLAAGNGREVRGLLMGMYLRGATIAAMCDGPIHGALSRIGELWQHDAAGVFIEHRAVDACLHAVSQLRSLCEPPETGPVAVGGAPSGDPYLLPTLLASIVLASEGIRAVNLGPDTPVPSLIHAANHHRPALVWMSVSTPPTAGLAAELDQLARDLTARGATLVVGGRHRHDLGPLRGAYMVASMGELAAFARGLATGRHLAVPAAD
ncbi:MAG: helix-turn-helix domain-containing protein [Myxococcales bacterium]|nr:helix-turn-helix domain-containing protein [Myxococcales bacterium]